MKCELCGDEIELYYEKDGKNLCIGCYDDPERKYKISKKSKTNDIKLGKKEEIICIKCNKKPGRSKLEFIDEQGNEIVLCNKCYDGISKDEKLKLIATSSKPFEINTGYMFGIAGGAGYKDSQKKGIDKVWKRYDLSFDEINEYSIMNFNRHFLICTNERRVAILGQMGRELKMKKLDEISIEKFNKKFKETEGKEKRLVKKELKKMLKNNFKKNKDKGTLYG